MPAKSSRIVTANLCSVAGPGERANLPALPQACHLPTPDSAMLRKTRVMLSVPPSARWMSMMEMSWLAGSIQPWVPNAPPWP